MHSFMVTILVLVGGSGEIVSARLSLDFLINSYTSDTTVMIFKHVKNLFNDIILDGVHL